MQDMRSILRRLWQRIFGIHCGTFYIGERRGQVVMMPEQDWAREQALDVTEKFWHVGADPTKDDCQSLRQHLARHMPGVKFLGFAVQ